MLLVLTWFLWKAKICKRARQLWVVCSEKESRGGRWEGGRQWMACSQSSLRATHGWKGSWFQAKVCVNISFGLKRDRDLIIQWILWCIRRFSLSLQICKFTRWFTQVTINKNKWYFLVVVLVLFSFYKKKIGFRHSVTHELNSVNYQRTPNWQCSDRYLPKVVLDVSQRKLRIFAKRGGSESEIIGSQFQVGRTIPLSFWILSSLIN